MSKNSLTQVLADNDVTKRLRHGRVTVTLTSQRTGEHITLRLRSKNRRLKSRYPTLEEAGILVCDRPAVGGGQTDWVGFIQAFDSGLTPRKNRQSDPARFWAFQQLWHYCRYGTLHPQLTLQIEDHCSRCSRALTDPESIKRGIGPECIGKVTGSKHQVRTPKQEQLDLKEEVIEEARRYPSVDPDSNLSPYAGMQSVVMNRAVNSDFMD